MKGCVSVVLLAVLATTGTYVWRNITEGDEFAVVLWFFGLALTCGIMYRPIWPEGPTYGDVNRNIF